ncbi:MAG: hypothetical protein MUO31_07085 [Thermodesulfovibrionales bacterium]|nr:hypothetical protein [Thermodesulfovibrionales bacterium]
MNTIANIAKLRVIFNYLLDRGVIKAPLTFHALVDYIEAGVEYCVQINIETLHTHRFIIVSVNGEFRLVRQSSSYSDFVVCEFIPPYALLWLDLPETRPAAMQFGSGPSAPKKTRFF